MAVCAPVESKVKPPGAYTDATSRSGGVGLVAMRWRAALACSVACAFGGPLVSFFSTAMACGVPNDSRMRIALTTLIASGRTRQGREQAASSLLTRGRAIKLIEEGKGD